MTNSEVRHPEVEVQLSGNNGNAFAILGTMKQAMRRANIPTAEIEQFHKEAMSGDYDHLLQTCMKWVNVK